MRTLVQPDQPLTVADYIARGEDLDDQQFELVDGRLVLMATGTPDHSITMGRLFGLLAAQLPSSHQPVLDVDIDLQVAPASGPGTVRRPDLAVVSVAELDRVRAEGGLLRASTVALAVEVISPGTRAVDQVAKRVEYASAGIPNYWIVDLEPDITLTALRLTAGGYVQHQPMDDLLVSSPFPLRIQLEVLVRR